MPLCNISDKKHVETGNVSPPVVPNCYDTLDVRLSSDLNFWNSFDSRLSENLQRDLHHRLITTTVADPRCFWGSLTKLNNKPPPQNQNTNQNGKVGILGSTPPITLGATALVWWQQTLRSILMLFDIFPTRPSVWRSSTQWLYKEKRFRHLRSRL